VKKIALILIALSLAFAATASAASKTLLGSTGDPWHARGTATANYIPVCTHQSLNNRLDESAKRHLAVYVNLLPRAAGGLPSSSCSTKAIAAGRQDAYLKQLAREIKAHPTVRVFIRYAPEFIGAWETWHGDTKAYVASWKHVYKIFHPVKAKLVWSPGLPWYGMGFRTWMSTAMTYWPGGKYVDMVDSTTVPHQDEAWSYFATRLPFLLAFHKPLTLGEVGKAIWPQATRWAIAHHVVIAIRLG
jgi:hypothetical protein